MLIRSAILDSGLREGWYEAANMLHRSVDIETIGVNTIGVNTKIKYPGGLWGKILQILLSNILYMLIRSPILDAGLL